MATGDNTAEAASSADRLLTEEVILAFFLSKSGEVRNSELVAHFRRALKSGQHRRANRQRFPQFVNRLATVRVEADGSKILTLKKKFRHREDASVTPDDVADEVANGDAAVAAAEVTDNGSQNRSDHEATASQAADGETMGSRQDDMSEMENNANCEKEQTTLEDATSKAVKTTTNDDDRKGESLADDEQRTQHDDKSAASTSSGNVDETQPATQETVTEDNVVDSGPGVASNPRGSFQAQLSSEGKSYDTGSVEETPSSTEETVSGNNIVDDGPGVTSTTEMKTKKAKKELSLEDKSYDNGIAEDIKPANDETATGGDIIDGRPNVLSADRTEVQNTEQIPPVVIVVEDQSSVEQSDEVDRGEYQGVKQLAQRIDKAASKTASTVTMRTKKQAPGRAQTGRPLSSTPYDFTMNDHQREWTLRASYSDYQALAKLLSLYQGTGIVYNLLKYLVENFFNFILLSATLCRRPRVAG